MNRKGFTLIELLAVVVIMGVILVIAIPSVVSSMNEAKQKQLQNAADNVEYWYTKQYELATVGVGLGSSGPDPAYTAFSEKAYSASTSASNKNRFSYNPNNLDPAPGTMALIAAGISNPDVNLDLYNSRVWRSGSTKMICVVLVAAEGGNFYVEGASNKKCSPGCPSTQC